MLDKNIKERLDEIAEEKGDLFLASRVFWELIELLPLKYQKEVLKLAERARKNY